MDPDFVKTSEGFDKCLFEKLSQIQTENKKEYFPNDGVLLLVLLCINGVYLAALNAVSYSCFISEILYLIPALLSLLLIFVVLFNRVTQEVLKRNS